MKTTTNYGLKKPDGTDLVNIEDLNANADSIDTQLAAKEGLIKSCAVTRNATQLTFKVKTSTKDHQFTLIWYSRPRATTNE